eukprot:TRINITY_DN29924_c0_g1_i1.p2 TRINITY_DN29924_c0_g1~~TRINITY_DN29924_c0_g1_i1.p2  ORF type:complete len:164 (+),score=60.07 TRINITY_DN29924_c0_g1_i1:296-787(+)
MNQDVDEVAAQAAAVGVDCVQLHGAEDTDYIQQLRQRLPTVAVIKVLHMPPAEDGAGVSMDALKADVFRYAEVCDSLLLDTSVKGQSGGTGQTFDWEAVRTIQEGASVPVLVAGGLKADNVAQLVAGVRPFGVDCSSGVEVAGHPGVKDHSLVAAYVSAARGA